MKVIPALLLFAIGVATTGAATRPNVLFLCVDDLKPELGCYGSTTAKTPNIDHLAARGTVFEHHYVQQAVCAPSRASMFTGLRPDSTRVWDLQHTCREENPHAFTMQEYFKNHGYQTAGAGKVMHGFKDDDPLSWSIPFMEPGGLAYVGGRVPALYQEYQSDAIHEAHAKLQASGIKGYGPQQAFMAKLNAKLSTERTDLPEGAYSDGAMTGWAITMLHQFSATKQPFFLTLGYRKPHLPFVAPKKYWDLYARDTLPLASFRQHAKDSPGYAYQPGYELGGYSDIDLDKLTHDEGKQRELIHGYYACVSYVDAQIGRLLHALKETGLDQSTVIVLWGDNGWHLGDHNVWCKHTNFEQATNTPLIISAPGGEAGRRQTPPVESVDIFPTLCALADLPVPVELEGVSIAPLLKGSGVPVKTFAISQYPDHWSRGLMGYALRTERYRFIAWVDRGVASGAPFDAATVDAFELYDYQTDPLETENLVAHEDYAPVVNQLTQQLNSFFEKRPSPADAAFKTDKPKASTP